MSEDKKIYCDHKHVRVVYRRWDPEEGRYIVGYECVDCGKRWEV